MNDSQELRRKKIDDLKELNECGKFSEFMASFPGFFHQTCIDPILKKDELSLDDLNAIQTFSENTLNYSLESCIVLLACVARGGTDKTWGENEEPLPSFGLNRQHAIHELASHAQELCSMFNTIAFHLNLKLQRKLEAEGKGGAQ